MAIALRALAMHEEPLRHDQMQIVLGAGHRDVEQAPFFFYFRRCAAAEGLCRPGQGRRELAGMTPGRRLRATGRITTSGGRRVIFNPRYELILG